MKTIIFFAFRTFLAFFNRLKRMVTTLYVYLYPITVCLKTLATTSYALLVYYVLHVASPRINEANCLINSHVACKYTDIKHISLSFIALLFMPRLSEHERSGAIGMLKASVRVSDVARYHNCHPSTIQRIRDCYPLLGRLKIEAGLVSQEWRPASRGNLRGLCIDDINIDDIRSSRHCQCQTNSRVSRVICF